MYSRDEYADGPLMAASKELYEALSDLRTDCEEGGFKIQPVIEERVRASIAKAREESRSR